MPDNGDPETPIYESATIERLAAGGEFSADIFAREFVAATRRTPEMPVDHETMVSWFAVALMNGHDKALRDG